MKGDLHLHSYYSDGHFAPAVVMQKAAAAGCEVVALTDHDTIGGLGEARAAAKQAGLLFIGGVEFSAYDGFEAHILGYGMDVHSPRFLAFIEAQKRRRRERSEKLLVNLARHGFTFPQGTFDFAVDRELSRSHIALAMVQLGYEPDYTTAFEKWMRSGSPTFVATQGTLPETAVEEIHAAGGLAVLAHPMRLKLDGYDRIAFIKRLHKAGLDGIEATYKGKTAKAFKDLASALGLFMTAGGDFHLYDTDILPRELACPQLLQYAK